MSHKTNVFYKKYWGLIKKVVTAVTDRKFSYGSCVTILPKKSGYITGNTGYKVVTDWLQSGYALFSYKDRNRLCQLVTKWLRTV